MIYIVTIFMVTMQVGSQFPNITNKVKMKMCGPCVSFRNFFPSHQSFLIESCQQECHYINILKQLLTKVYFGKFFKGPLFYFDIFIERGDHSLECTKLIHFITFEKILFMNLNNQSVIESHIRDDLRIKTYSDC